MNKDSLPSEYIAQVDVAGNSDLFVTLSTQMAKAVLGHDSHSLQVKVVNDYADMALESFKKQIPQLDENLACSKGCNHCCYLPVKTTPQHVNDIAHYIVQTWSKSDVTSLVQRLRFDVNKRVSNDARAPCPLLNEEGACRIYEHRPLSCRAFTSYDVATCQASVAGQSSVLQQPIRFKVYEAATTAMLAVNQKRKGGDKAVYLSAGLLRVLAGSTT